MRCCRAKETFYVLYTNAQSPECPDVYISHASLGVVGLEITGLGGVDDAIQATFHLNTLTRLDSQMCVRLEPVVRTRHQHALWQHTETQCDPAMFTIPFSAYSENYSSLYFNGPINCNAF